ncbi:hypothetical protein Bbelb_136120 [Branchiostoma belcheri]|nr:hypothetical protein Bbelb_136120 [Branchiostoma belcheri]
MPEGRSLRSTRIPTEKMVAFKSDMERNKVKVTATKDGGKQPALQSRFHTRRTTAVTGRPPTPPKQVSSTTDASSARISSSLNQCEELSPPGTSKHSLEGTLEPGKKTGSGSPEQSPMAEEKHDNIFSMLEELERKGTVVQPGEGRKVSPSGGDISNPTTEMKSSTESPPTISPTTRFKISVFKLKCPTTVSQQQAGQTLSMYGRAKATVVSTTIPSNFVSRSLTFEPKVSASFQDTNELRDKPALAAQDDAKTEKKPVSLEQSKSRGQGTDGDLLCEEQMCDSDEFDSPKRKQVAQMLAEQGASSDSEELVPDVDDINGVMFVSFSSKQAISAHSSVERETREKFGNELDKVLIELGQNKSGRKRMAKDSPDSTEAAELYDKIAMYEKLLRAEVKRSKSGEILHPELSRKHIGLSNSPTLNLKELGVDMDVLQSPPRDSSPRSPEHSDGSKARASPQGSILASILMAPKDRSMIGSPPCVRYPEPSPVSPQFVSRTGKTTDITKIKGWKSKLAILSPTKVSPLPTSSSKLDQTASVSSTHTMPSVDTTKFQSMTHKPKKANQAAKGKVTKKKKKVPTGLSSIPEGSSIKVVSKEMVESWMQSGKKQRKKRKKALENQDQSFKPYARWRPPKTPDHPTPPLRQFTSNVVTATMALKAVMAVLSSGWRYCNDREHCNEPSCMLDGCRCGKSSPESRRVSILKDDHDDATCDEKNPRRRPRRRVTAKSLSFFNAMNYEYYPELSTSPPKKKKSRDVESDDAPPKKKRSPESVERTQTIVHEKKTSRAFQPRDKKTGKFLKKALLSPPELEPPQPIQRFKQIKAMPLLKPFNSQQTTSKSDVQFERTARPEPVVESYVNTRFASHRWIEDEDRDDDITMTCARARVHRRTAKTRPCSCGIKHHHHHNKAASPEAKRSPGAKKSPETFRSKSPQVGKKVLQGTKSPKANTENVSKSSPPQSLSVKVFKPKTQPQAAAAQDQPEVSGHGKLWMGRTMQIGPGIIGALATAGNSSKPPEQNSPSKAAVLKLVPGANPNAPKVYVPVSSTLEKVERGSESTSASLPKLPQPNPAAPQQNPSVGQQSASPHTSSQGGTPTATATAVTVASNTKTKPGHPSKIPVVTVPQAALQQLQYPQSQLILIEQKTTNPSTGPGKQSQQIVHSPKLVEIISTCNWDSARNLILKMIAQQSQSLSLPRVFQVADFFIEVMGPSQERRIYNLPANLLQTLPPRIQSARVKIWKQLPLKTAAGKPAVIVPLPTSKAQVKPTSNPHVEIQAVPSMAKSSGEGQKTNVVQKKAPTAPSIQVKLTAEQAKQKLNESAAGNAEVKPSTPQEKASDVPSQIDLPTGDDLMSDSNARPSIPEESGTSTVRSHEEQSEPVKDGVAESLGSISNTTASSETTTGDASASSVKQGSLSHDKETPARSSDDPLITAKSSGESGEPKASTHEEMEGGMEESKAREGANECGRQETVQSSSNDIPDDTPTSTKAVTTTTVANHGEETAVKTAVEAVLSTKQVTATSQSVSPNTEPHIPSDDASAKDKDNPASSLVDVEEQPKENPPSPSTEVIGKDNRCTGKDEDMDSEQKQPIEEEATLAATKEVVTEHDKDNLSSKSSVSKPDGSVDTPEHDAEEGHALSEKSEGNATLQKQSSSQAEMKSLEPSENVVSDPAANDDDVARGTGAGEAIVSGRKREDSCDSKSSAVQDKPPCIQQKEGTENVSVDSDRKEQESASQPGNDNKDEDSTVDNDLEHSPSTSVTKEVDSSQQQENQPSKVSTSGTFIPENPLDSLITRVAASIASAEKANNVDPAKRVTSTGTFVPENPLLEDDEAESSEESEDSTSSSDSSSSDEEESTQTADESTEEQCKDPVDSPPVEGSKEVSEPKAADDTTDDDKANADDDKAADPSDDEIRETAPRKEGSKESEEPSGGSQAAEKHEIPEKTESPKKIATSGIFVPTVATDEQNQWLENQATHTSTDQHHETRQQEKNKEGKEAMSKDQAQKTNGDNGQEVVSLVSSEEDNADVVDVDGLQAPSVCSVHSLKVKKRRKSVMEEFEPDDVEFIEKGREELMAEAAEAKKSLLDRRLGVSRLLHISNERRRRKEIRDLFGNLKEMLGIPREDDRVPNIHVLTKSKEVIDQLKREESQLMEAKQNLFAQRNKLIKRIANSPQSAYSGAELRERFMLASEEPGFFDDRLMNLEVDDTKSDSGEETYSRPSSAERTERPPKVTRHHVSQFASGSIRKEGPPKLTRIQPNVSRPLRDSAQEEASVLQQEFLKGLERLKKGEELPEPKLDTEDTSVKDTAPPEMEVEVPKTKPLEKETQEAHKRKLVEEDATTRTDAQGGRLRKKARKSTFRKTNANRKTITPQQLSNLEQTQPSRDDDRPGTDSAKSQDLPDSQLKTAGSKEDKTPAPDPSRPSKGSAQQPGQSGPVVGEAQGASGMQTFKIQGGTVKSLTNLAAAGAKKPNILRTTRPQTPTQLQDSQGSLVQLTRESTGTKGGCVKMSAGGIQITPGAGSHSQAATVTNVPIVQLAGHAPPRGQPIFLENCDFLPAGGVIAVPIQGAASPAVTTQDVATPVTTTGQVHLTSTKPLPELVPVTLSADRNDVSKLIKVVSIASSPSPVPSGSSEVAPHKEAAMVTTTATTAGSETKVSTTSNSSLKLVPVTSTKGQFMRFSIVDNKTSIATPVGMVSSVKSTTPTTSGSSSETKPVPTIQVIKCSRVVTLPVGTVLSSKVHVAQSGAAKLASAPVKLAPAPVKIAPAPVKLAPPPQGYIAPVKDVSPWMTLHMEQDEQSGFLTAKMKLKGAGRESNRTAGGAKAGVVPACKTPNTELSTSGKVFPTIALEKTDKDVGTGETVEHEDSSNSGASKATEADTSQTAEVGEKDSSALGVESEEPRDVNSAATDDPTEQQEATTA